MTRNTDTMCPRLVSYMGVTIRLATEEDAAAITEVYRPIVENTHISFETVPPTVEEMTGRILTIVIRFPWLVCEHDGTVIGYAYATTHRDRAAYQWGIDVSVYVDESYQRKNVARGLYESLFELTALQGFYTAYAVIALPNRPSVSFHESFGFEQIGLYRQAGFRNGQWHDVGHWERQIQPVSNPPSSPKPLEDLVGSRRFDDAIKAGKASIQL